MMVGKQAMGEDQEMRHVQIWAGEASIRHTLWWYRWRTWAGYEAEGKVF